MSNEISVPPAENGLIDELSHQLGLYDLYMHSVLKSDDYKVDAPVVYTHDPVDPKNRFQKEAYFRHKETGRVIRVDAETKLERSMRLLRKKLRFACCMSQNERMKEGFSPDYHIVLTIAPKFWEACGFKQDIPLHLTKMLHDLRNDSVFWEKYGWEKGVWRIELGNRKTHRPHVHMLIQLLPGKYKDSDEFHNAFYAELIARWGWQYAGGTITQIHHSLKKDRHTFSRVERCKVVLSYVSKYFSKSETHTVKRGRHMVVETFQEEIDPNEVLYESGKKRRRFQTFGKSWACKIPTRWKLCFTIEEIDAAKEELVEQSFIDEETNQITLPEDFFTVLGKKRAINGVEKKFNVKQVTLKIPLEKRKVDYLSLRYWFAKNSWLFAAQWLREAKKRMKKDNSGFSDILST